jgi:hypothetical protein
MRTVLAVLFPLILTGCGLPPAITAISYALDGMSLFSTGKAVSDHALSMAMEQDCKVWRVVEDKSVCRDLLPGESNALIAQAKEWQNGQEIVGQQEPRIRPRGSDLIQTISSDPVVVPNYLDGLVSGYDGIIRSEIPVEMPPAAFGMRMNGAFGAAAKPPADKKSNSSQVDLDSGWSPPEESADMQAAVRRMARIAPAAKKDDPSIKARVVVLGSFSKRANARRAALKWRALGASVAPSQVGVKTMYRVVTAPVSDSQYVSELRRIRSAGIRLAWALPLCNGNATTGACINLQASATE